jgi:hypothetical protein
MASSVGSLPHQSLGRSPVARKTDFGHGANAGSCAFIVLAHRGHEQVLRLIDRLAPAPTFVHVDRSARPHVYRELLANARDYPSVRFLPRVRSPWAGWGIVEAELSGLRAAHALGVAHTAILTGQDYPLISLAEIEAFAQRHRGRSFLASWEYPSPLYGPDGGMQRIRYWHHPIARRRFRIPVARPFPSGIKPYGGSAYCLLSHTAIGDLLDFVSRRSDLLRFARHVWIPDELLIATALHNSPSHKDIIDENLWFMDWPSGDAKHPRTLRSSDADALLAAAGREATAAGRARAKLFARKFDAEVDSSILDLLDERAAQGEAIQRAG